MERLVAVAARDGERGAIVRKVGDHPFVVLRIPGGGAKQRIELRVRELAQSFQTNGIGGHDCDANAATGWTCGGFEEKPCRK